MDFDVLARDLLAVHISPAEYETAYYHQHTDAEETLSA
jgi:hypothetical protein